ncbi:hypothetical protein [Haladaptatus sp. DYF46]|uniref:hypothetical protein n=1 Tax=Haladaptatus sp. DYF46 TaxID=2886041 RepID=UPI001E58F3F9|nr:hypothetical protein [Haladaptatus sp. DYF46]
MDGKNSDRESEANTTDSGFRLNRRRAIQLAGLGIGSVAMSGGGSAAETTEEGDCAEGPFERTYSGGTVNFGRIASRSGRTGMKGQSTAAGEPASKREIEASRAHGQHGRHRHDQKHGWWDDDDELSILTEYDGVNAEQTSGGVPSDSQIAAGYGKVIHAVNTQVAVFDKRSGHEELSVQLNDIFAPVIDEPEGGYAYGEPFVFDPRARYDRRENRYVVAAVQYEPGITENGELVTREEMEERAGGEPGEGEDGEDGEGEDDAESEAEALARPPRGWWVVAVSETPNPNGKWNVYRIPPLDNEGLVDYPTLGLDRDAIYLAQNFFGDAVSVTMVALDKEAIYRGRTTTGNHFTDLDNPNVEQDDFTLQPALQPSSGGRRGTFYLLDSTFPDPTASALTMWELTDPLDDPTLECHTVPVEEFSYPPTAEQPDSDKRIDTLGTRQMNLDYNDGSLWTAHTIAYDWNGDGETVAAIKWYEVDTRTRQVVQSGVYGEPGTSYFIPTIQSDDDTTVITHNVSGPDTFPSMAVAGRTEGYERNKLEDSVVVEEGKSHYDYGEGEEVMRWGDYNGISVDPHTGTFWTVSQYSPDIDIDPAAEERDPYHTRIAEVTFGDGRGHDHHGGHGGHHHGDRDDRDHDRGHDGHGRHRWD